MSDDYESVCLMKPEVFVYRIPPLANNRGHKAADWNLDDPNWVGRMRLIAIGKKLELRLEDKSSGQLFAKAPIDEYPGICIEPVIDSSRYFVVRLKNDNGQTAFIGMGFGDRGDSFDLNVALQDHFKYIEKSSELEKEDATAAEKPKLDLGFKEGQTITLTLGKKGSSAPRQRPATSASTATGGIPLLPPPPPGGTSISQRARPGTTASHGQNASNVATSTLKAMSGTYPPRVRQTKHYTTFPRPECVLLLGPPTQLWEMGRNIRSPIPSIDPYG
ncbi:unnamed protein product [Toxocara canis]|uniref:DUF1681 domain-containing protein n=1 Tax=Toxocara canis TaxID=6265 RepID=A0A183UZ09_TOXCA|nr:unnamed protein product [Toxocara canis]